MNEARGWAALSNLLFLSAGVRLVQVAEYQLHGNVQSMGKIQLTQAKREALLLTFMDAKVQPPRLVIASFPGTGC